MSCFLRFLPHVANPPPPVDDHKEDKEHLREYIMAEAPKRIAQRQKQKQHTGLQLCRTDSTTVVARLEASGHRGISTVLTPNKIETIVNTLTEEFCDRLERERREEQKMREHGAFLLCKRRFIWDMRGRILQHLQPRNLEPREALVAVATECTQELVNTYYHSATHA